MLCGSSEAAASWVADARGSFIVYFLRSSEVAIVLDLLTA
jgi:hypothetical protein